MNSQDRYLATMLSASAPGYSALAAERMLAQDPTLKDRFGSATFQLWKEHLTDQIQGLSAAIRESDPGMFIKRIQWARTSLENRQVAIADLSLALGCLKQVLAQELPEANQEQAAHYLDSAANHLEIGSTPEPGAAFDLNTKAGVLAAKYVKTVLEGQRRPAIELVVDACDKGDVSLTDAYMKVLLPAQVEIGKLWLANEINIAEEHFVSNTTKAVMGQLAGKAPKPQPRNVTVITASVAGDAHDIGIQAVADFFHMDGWNVVHLGCDVPHEDLALAVRDFSASLLALSATLDVHRRIVEDAVHVVKHTLSEDQTPKILVGGLAFAESEEQCKAIGADAYSESPAAAVAHARQLLGLN